MSWKTVLLPDAEAELAKLPSREAAAVANVIKKLEAEGIALGAPHSSQVKGNGDHLRELRPRGGDSPWRAFYRREGDVFVIAAIGPEHDHDSRGFKKAVKVASERLSELEVD